MAARADTSRLRRALALGSVALLGLGLRSAAVASFVPEEPGPDLPPQPGVHAKACTYKAPAESTFSMVATEAGGSTTPSYQVTTDPWSPCRLYRASSDQTLQRSDDGGGTWNQVFADSAQNPGTGAAFSASGVVVGRPDSVVLSERSNGDALVRSADAGATWTIARSIGAEAVDDVAFSPADPSHGWAVGLATRCMPTGSSLPSTSVPLLGSVAVPGQACVDVPWPDLYATTDGGATWTILDTDTYFTPDLTRCANDSKACMRAAQVIPDPSDANAVFFLFSNSTLSWIFHVSGNFFSISECTEAITGMTVFHRQGGTRLLLLVPSQSPQLQLTDEYCGFAGDAFVAPSPLTDPAVSADPRDPQHVVFAGITPDGVLRLVSSADAFASAGRVRNATLPGLHAPALRVSTPLRAASDGVSRDPRLLLQFDRSGSLLVAAQETCTSGCDWTHRQSYWRFTPVFPPPPPVHTGGGGGGGGGSGGPPSPPPPPAQGGTMRTVAQCAELPAPPNPSQRNGTVAFDGRYLVYSDMENPAPYHALVHRLDPTTCRPAGDLDVVFDPSQVQGSGTVIDKLVEENNTNQLIATVFSQGSFGGGDLFTLRITDEGAPGRAGHAVAAHLMTVGSCDGTPGDTLISYDFSDDTLWQCTGTPGKPGHTDMAGTPIASCFSTFGVGGARTSTTNTSSWAIGGPRHIYLHSEDDHTIWEYDDLTCQQLATFTHPQWAESEDEQFACDGVSFGPQSGVAAPTSVFWVRDNGARLIAYAVPDVTCPFATSLAYSGPTSVGAGRDATLCATVALVGRDLPPEHLPISFDLAGSPAGTASTDSSGRACLTTPIDRTAGMYTVGARFTGLPGFQPSEDEGALRVIQTIRLGAPFNPGPTTGAAIPVGAAIAKPPVAPGAPVARGGGEAIQVQTQPAPQNVNVPQPVVSNQREQQINPALGYAQQASGDEVQPDYAMSALPDGGIMRRLRSEELAAGALALLAGFGAGAMWTVRSAAQHSGPRRGRKRR